jgi:hypothetical protein
VDGEARLAESGAQTIPEQGVILDQQKFHDPSFSYQKSTGLSPS